MNLAADNVTCTPEVLAKHHSGQFDYVLAVTQPGHRTQRPATDRSSLSCAAGSAVSPAAKKLWFGLSLLPRRPSGGCTPRHDAKANSYVLLATPLAINAKVIAEEPKSLTPPVMAMSEPPAYEAVPSKAATPAAIKVTEVSVENMMDQLSLRSPTKEGSRIEDSVEALDKLEEQLEAIDEAMSPQALALASDGEDSPTRPAPKRTTSGSKSASSNGRSPSAAARSSLAPASRSTSGRRTASAASKTKDDGEAPTAGSSEAKQTSGGPPTTRKVPRPASLLPPKPLAKSTRPPTIPTFELPGEAVSRRLKEQREARMSLNPTQITPEQARALAAAAAPPRPKSSKPPTRPTFELPGEAISRRKREEREARLKAEAEEEKRRREFKARPIRHSISSATVLPRETIASRARQMAKGVSTENASGSAASHAAGAAASQPVVCSKTVGAAATRSPSAPARQPLAATTNASTSASRGRGSTPSMTRETSVAASSVSTTSNTTLGSGGSGSGTARVARSTVSAEDIQSQRARARLIAKSDDRWREDKQAQRREREEMARRARAIAADRSRLAGREWAEKQRLKAQAQAAAAKRASVVVATAAAAQ